MIKARIQLTEAQTKALQEAYEDSQTQERIMREFIKAFEAYQDQPPHPQCGPWNGGFATLKPLCYIRSNGKR